MAEYHNEQLTIPDALVRDAMVINNRTMLYEDIAYVEYFHKAIGRLSGAMLTLLIEIDMISKRLDLIQKKYTELETNMKSIDEAVHRLEFPQL